MLVPILLKATELWVLSLLNTQSQYRQPLPKIHLCFFISIEGDACADALGGGYAMKSVLYARYSSDSQREESIEGQLRECAAFAEKNGITVFV